MKVHLPGAAWGLLGGCVGRWMGEQPAAWSCSPADSCWPCSWAVPPTSCACTHRHVPELLLALGSVGRGTWHAHTLMPLMMGSTQHVPLLFKEGMGTAQNCPDLVFLPLQGEKGDRGERVSGSAFP